MTAPAHPDASPDPEQRAWLAWEAQWPEPVWPKVTEEGRPMWDRYTVDDR